MDAGYCRGSPSRSSTRGARVLHRRFCPTTKARRTTWSSDKRRLDCQTIIHSDRPFRQRVSITQTRLRCARSVKATPGRERRAHKYHTVVARRDVLRSSRLAGSALEHQQVPSSGRGDRLGCVLTLFAQPLESARTSGECMPQPSRWSSVTSGVSAPGGPRAGATLQSFVEKQRNRDPASAIAHRVACGWWRGATEPSKTPRPSWPTAEHLPRPGRRRDSPLQCRTLSLDERHWVSMRSSL
jgi:hypothetical protein